MSNKCGISSPNAKPHAGARPFDNPLPLARVCGCSYSLSSLKHQINSAAAAGVHHHSVSTAVRIFQAADHASEYLTEINGRS